LEALTWRRAYAAGLPRPTPEAGVHLAPDRPDHFLRAECGVAVSAIDAPESVSPSCPMCLSLVEGAPGRPVDFDEARALVEAHLRRLWQPENDGTLYVAPYGAEDADAWHVIAGAREYLVEGDWRFLRVGEGARLVEKATGRLLHLALPNEDNFRRLGAMTRLGDWPPD